MGKNHSHSIVQTAPKSLQFLGFIKAHARAFRRLARQILAINKINDLEAEKYFVCVGVYRQLSSIPGIGSPPHNDSAPNLNAARLRR